MKWKKIGRAMLFPHIAVALALLPISVAGMLIAMHRLGNRHPLTVFACATAFYALVILCLRVPEIVRWCQNFKNENIFMRIWLNDHRLRMNVILCLNVLWDMAYGSLQLGMGIRHRSAWFYSLAAYYASLAVMRFFLLRHTLHHPPGKKLRREWIRYRSCGRVLLLMNLALSGMVFYMIYENRVTRHHEITTIAMAIYSFFSLTWSIISVFRYRKYNSPAMSASRAVSLAAACVSMLTLENTMLVTFGKDSITAQTRQIFLSLSGGVILIFIVVMAVFMIVRANRKLREN